MSRNRYVGDYRLVESIDGRGRIRTDYEYIGAPYVFAEGDDAARRALRIAAGLCAVGWAAFVAALLPVSAAGRTFYVCLPFAFEALPLGFMAATIFETLRTKPPFEHRHADRLENRCPACSFFAVLLAAVALLGEAISALRGVEMLPGDIVFCLGAAVVLACGAACHRLWKRARCRKADAAA